ncbi:MAG TPA: carboxypeptidase-like regulatory domain-containing protein, partial [Vicinamibacterales bacterium]|nr:carboxypeptidase-like regulatory domain-containing protein [Vicinamibacterales bacterium]
MAGISVAHTRLAVVVLVVLTLAASSVPSAQVATGSIVGTVTDSSNQVVPGAQVTIREVNRNTTTTLVTDASGVYTAPFLVPGTYEVQVELQGFKTWTRPGIILQVTDRVRVDVALEVGTITEATTVVASAPVVRTDSSEAGTVIEEMAIKELPLNGRNFATLVYLAPGITPGQAGENLSGASTFNPRGASNFNALGSQANSNAWLVDGIDNNEFTFNTFIVMPSVEQVREFKVLTGVFSAEFGRGAGVVSVSTKSGANQLRGTGYEFLRNDAFDARNFFVRKTVQPDGTLVKDPVPPLDRHQFGGAIGGAFVIPGLYDGHSRTFFFADYSGIKERRGITTVNTVPSAATRTGDFSNYRDRSGNLIPIYDPLSTRLEAGRVVRDPFPNNIIPANRINQVGRNIASVYPLPNTGSGSFDNYISTPDREITDHAFSGRVDHKLSDNDSFFVRFNYGKYRLDAPQGQANCCLPTPAEAAARFDLGPFVAGIQNTRLTTHGMAFNYSKVIKPQLVNELRIGYASTQPFTTQSDYGHRSAETLGIRGINVSEITTGLPNIDITNFTGISGGPAFLPVNPAQFHYQIEDALVWLTGRHQMKFGYRLVDRSPK